MLKISPSWMGAIALAGLQGLIRHGVLSSALHAGNPQKYELATAQSLQGMQGMLSEEGQGERMPGAVLIAVSAELTLPGAGGEVWGAAVGRVGNSCVHPSVCFQSMNNCILRLCLVDLGGFVTC